RRLRRVALRGERQGRSRGAEIAVKRLIPFPSRQPERTSFFEIVIPSTARRSTATERAARDLQFAARSTVPLPNADSSPVLGLAFGRLGMTTPISLRSGRHVKARLVSAWWPHSSYPSPAGATHQRGEAYQPICAILRSMIPL